MSSNSGIVGCQHVVSATHSSDEATWLAEKTHMIIRVYHQKVFFRANTTTPFGGVLGVKGRILGRRSCNASTYEEKEVESDGKEHFCKERGVPLHTEKAR